MPATYRGIREIIQDKEDANSRMTVKPSAHHSLNHLNVTWYLKCHQPWHDTCIATSLGTMGASKYLSIHSSILKKQREESLDQLLFHLARRTIHFMNHTGIPNNTVHHGCAAGCCLIYGFCPYPILGTFPHLYFYPFVSRLCPGLKPVLVRCLSLPITCTGSPSVLVYHLYWFAVCPCLSPVLVHRLSLSITCTNLPSVHVPVRPR